MMIIVMYILAACMTCDPAVMLAAYLLALLLLSTSECTLHVI
jgi:hypothetical protein